MIVIRTPDELKTALAGASVTIGNFDGVHKGHQALIKRTCVKATASGLTSAIVTFDPHPLRVLTERKTPPFITLTDQKLELISQFGPQVALVLAFTREMAALSPEQFVKQYLVDGLNMKELTIGYDYHMGKGRTGDHAMLTQIGDRLGFGVERLDPVALEGAIVSSTRIRDLVEAGDVWDARPLLGRFYQVSGEVVHGMKRGGKLLGFPTANLKLVDELFPKPGVYAVWVEVDGQAHEGVANIGKNPTFGNDALSVEAHILDYDKDIYGRDIRVHFVQRIRDERKFNGIDELKERIRRDVGIGRQILARPEGRIKITQPSIEDTAQ